MVNSIVFYTSSDGNMFTLNSVDTVEIERKVKYNGDPVSELWVTLASDRRIRLYRGEDEECVEIFRRFKVRLRWAGFEII